MGNYLLLPDYLKDYQSVKDAVKGLEKYFEFYNRERLHQSLQYQTPEAVFRQGQKQAAVPTLKLTDFWS